MPIHPKLYELVDGRLLADSYVLAAAGCSTVNTEDLELNILPVEGAKGLGNVPKPSNQSILTKP